MNSPQEPEPTKKEENDLATAKSLALNSIIPQCRELGAKFFQCVEENIKPIGKDGKPLTYQQMEQEINLIVIPNCMKLYNLDDCLQKYEKKI